jgi:hypothetical protein
LDGSQTAFHRAAGSTGAFTRQAFDLALELAVFLDQLINHLVEVVY